MSFTAIAHQPDISSTMLIEQSPNTWVLQIRTALTAFEYEVKMKYGENAYKTPEEFKDLVLELIKNNMSIVFNKQKIELANGSVKLGHETSVVFEVIGTSEAIETISVSNRVFTDIHKNQSALLLIKKGVPKEHFVLNEKNEHTILLRYNGSRFIDLNNKFWSSKLSYSSIGLFLGISLLFLGILFWRKSKNQKIININHYS
jgi:hypothetical protein